MNTTLNNESLFRKGLKSRHPTYGCISFDVWNSSGNYFKLIRKEEKLLEAVRIKFFEDEGTFFPPTKC